MSEDIHTSGRPSGADTRQRILVAAVELFSANGYAGTSVRDIADALGMTKAALYYHFAGKEQILQAVTAPLHEDMSNLIRWAVTPPRPAPAELLTALVNLLSRHAPLLSSVFGDPSVARRHLPEDARGGMTILETMLADSAEPSLLLRARCALGAVFGGVTGVALQDSRFTGRPHSELAARLLNREEELLDPGQRQEVVAAALRALGVPNAEAPSGSVPGRPGLGARS